ncbi:MAG: AmmeMemoRadiSam system radical SAM enzyme [Calditrichia bacterium]
MQEARFYRKLSDGRLHCYLCPRNCKLKPGQNGFCFVRQNIDGKLYSLAYARPYAVNVDPIEKKPLFHVLPGTRALSIGTAGCNMACKYCQNWDLSKAKIDNDRAMDISPVRLVQMALHYQSQSIAYTYNEPTVFAEYAMDTAEISRAQGLKNVMVTNGYITTEVIPEVYRHMDAANVDLKAFTSKFYENLTLSRLEPVLAALKKLHEIGIWIEITNLIIPGYNDDLQEIIEMCDWIKTELDPFTPVHFTAFHPSYKLTNVPSTRPGTLLNIRETALKRGLHYVYVGNITNEPASSTYCHNCQALLIRRNWYQTEVVGLRDGKCQKCNTTIPGIFS